MSFSALKRKTFTNAIRSLKLSTKYTRQFHASRTRQSFNACVIGAAGGIGQPLSMLLKYNPLVNKLSLFDIAPFTPGVAADIGHINTSGGVPCTGYGGAENILENMGKALADAHIVIIPAGVPRQPGMARDDLFNMNATIVADVAKKCSEVCPDAFYLVISNPVNSTVPIFAEVLKKHNTYDKKKLFGVTTLDVCRSKTFIAENQGWNVENVDCTVIGGHAGITILPLLSQVEGANFSKEDIEALTKRISFGGDEVVQAKAGAGSATLSMAHAAAVFTNMVLRAADGEEGIVECSYVDSNLVPELPFFASPVRLNQHGVEDILPLPKLSDFEQECFNKLTPQLKGEIQKGVDWVDQQNAK